MRFVQWKKRIGFPNAKNYEQGWQTNQIRETERNIYIFTNKFFFFFFIFQLKLGNVLLKSMGKETSFPLSGKGAAKCLQIETRDTKDPVFCHPIANSRRIELVSRGMIYHPIIG